MSPHYFDQNTGEWSGVVQIMSRSAMEYHHLVDTLSTERKYAVALWEDDDTSCEIRDDPNRLRNHLGYLANNTAFGVFFVLACPYISGTVCGIGIWGVLLNYLGIGWSYATTNDDYVGLAVEKASTAYIGVGTHALFLDPTTSINGGITLVYKP